MPPDELSIIDRYFRPLAGEGGFDLRDDAARLDVSADCDLVVTTDMVTESVHFLSGDPPDTVAQKALRVNLSDLAAKGATPLAYVLSAGFGPQVDERWLGDFADGLRRDQEAFAVRLLGGDTTSAPAHTTIAITAFGCAAKGRMVHRFCGQPEDRLYVSGVIGAGGVGLAILKGEAGSWDRLSRDARDLLVARYQLPEPRVTLGKPLAEFASAAMDVSDGLIGDCDKLCRASGCTAALIVDRVPLPTELREVGAELVARLLTAGDDYEILAAIPPDRAPDFERAAKRAGVPVTEIGFLCEGEGPTRVTFHGQELPLKDRSYMHGRIDKSHD